MNNDGMLDYTSNEGRRIELDGVGSVTAEDRPEYFNPNQILRLKALNVQPHHTTS